MVVFSVGDKVLACLKEHRTDEQVVYTKQVGTIVDCFNAWGRDGDHWRYKIKDETGKVFQFYDGLDEGELTLLEDEDDIAGLDLFVTRIRPVNLGS